MGLPMVSILIIDDDEPVRSATKMMLNTYGFEAVGVADGKAGVEAINHRHFDLVLVDLFMPDSNGLDTTKAIIKSSPLTPVIVVSGFFGGSSLDMPGFEAMALEAGAKAVQYKPIRPKELLEKIQSVIAAAAKEAREPIG